MCVYIYIYIYLLTVRAACTAVHVRKPGSAGKLSSNRTAVTACDARMARAQRLGQR